MAPNPKLTATFSQPAVNGRVTATLSTIDSFSVEDTVYVSSGGYYTIVAIPSAYTLILVNPGFADNAAEGTDVESGSEVIKTETRVNFPSTGPTGATGVGSTGATGVQGATGVGSTGATGVGSTGATGVSGAGTLTLQAGHGVTSWTTFSSATVIDNTSVTLLGSSMTSIATSTALFPNNSSAGWYFEFVLPTASLGSAEQIDVGMWQSSASEVLILVSNANGTTVVQFFAGGGTKVGNTITAVVGDVFAASFDGTNISFFQNGALQASTTAAAVSWSTSTSTQLEVRSGTSSNTSEYTITGIKAYASPLKGSQGATGVGSTGATGVGSTGATGVQGATGVGSTGATGVGSTGATGVQGATGVSGGAGSKMAVVDGTSGSDTTGSVGGGAFKTISAAISAVNTAGSGDGTGYLVYVNPGTYTETLSLITGLHVKGASAVSTIILQSGTFSGQTILASMAESSVLESVTLKLTSTSHQNFIGVYLSGTQTATAAVRGCRIVLDNSGASSSGNSGVWGIYASNTGTPASDWTTVSDTSILVASTGTGQKVGILIDSSGSLRARRCHARVTQTTSSNNTYIAVQCQGTGTLDFREGSANGASADVSQSSGTLVLDRSTELVNHNANSLSFTVDDAGLNPVFSTITQSSGGSAPYSSASAGVLYLPLGAYTNPTNLSGGEILDMATVAIPVYRDTLVQRLVARISSTPSSFAVSNLRWIVYTGSSPTTMSASALVTNSTTTSAVGILVVGSNTSASLKVSAGSFFAIGMAFDSISNFSTCSAAIQVF